MSQTENLSLLGKKTEYKQNYAPEVLEAFENRHLENDYWVTFDCPEFTSLCPITGQPDFATIRVDYIPDTKMVESKSLKLYLFSFRNHGAFHEDCTIAIAKIRNSLLEAVSAERALLLALNMRHLDEAMLKDSRDSQVTAIDAALAAIDEAGRERRG